MKIAFCLSGQPRFYKQGFDSCIKNIFSNYSKCDVFIHTWFSKKLVGTQFNTTHQGSINKVGTYENNTIEQILEMYKPKSLLLDEPKLFNTNLNFSQENLREGVCPNNIYSMFYSIYKSIQLKTEYETLNNFKYDIVVRSRFDLCFLNPINFENYNSNTIVVPHSNNPNVVYDIFGFSNSSNMNCYGETFNNIHKLWCPTKHFIGEQLLTDNITQYNIPITKIDYQIDLFRA